MKILVLAESETSLLDAIEKLFEEVKSLYELKPRFFLFGMSEKDPAIIGRQLKEIWDSAERLFPGTRLNWEYLLSNKDEAMAMFWLG